jgi:hypothetical protein
MKENYVEEFKKAEGMMDEKEEKMSRMREDTIARISKELFQDLKQGKFDLKINPIRGVMEENITVKKNLENLKEKSVSLTGKIGERTINISLQGHIKTGWNEYFPTSINGWVDGERIDDEFAVDLFNKYCDVAKLQDNRFFEKKANEEIGKEREIE